MKVEQIIIIIIIIYIYVPLAVETYGNWAKDTFSHLATRLAIGSHKSKSSPGHVFELYSKLNLTLTRSIVRAIMVRTLVA